MSEVDGNYVYVIENPFKWVDRGLATASWFDEYTILPGEYPVKWTNIRGDAWNPDPEVHTPGYIANIGPYYGEVTLNVIRTREYRENRLLHVIRADDKDVHVETTKTISTYSYLITDGGHILGGCGYLRKLH